MRREWPEIQNAMIDGMIRLEAALRPHIDKITGVILLSRDFVQRRLSHVAPLGLGVVGIPIFL